jgi:hypothetical protein
MKIKNTNPVEIKNFKKNYIFLFENNEEKTFFCTCGKKVNKMNNEADDSEVKIDIDSNPYAEIDLFYRLEKTHNVICPKCKTNYALFENAKKIKTANFYFYSTFELKEEGNRITLYNNLIKSSCTDKSKYVNIKKDFSYISIDRENKKLFLKKYNKNKEQEFSLDSIVNVVENFFNKDSIKDSEIEIIENLFDIHRFINKLASLVVDSKNMDIVEGLMSQMIGKPGMDVMSKIITIFLGIICYSNLSTIALTKGTVFLYDMMKSCNLPNVVVLSDNNVTSPIKIFNFLVSLENEKIQKDLDSEKGLGQDFVYKSKDGSKKISFNLDDINMERFGINIQSSTIDISEGKINVREDLTKKTVSKYIFNKIENFDDYKKLIRFTKFISYEELIDLTMKYDVEYLINLFDLIEFRDDINSYSLKQIIPLTLDYLDKFDNKNLKTKYEHLKSFSFNNYDDSVRMILDLKWDRKKDFDKIKTVNELNLYHDRLVEHYNMLSDKEKYEKFRKIAEKFRYLEDYDKEEGLKITLLATPQLVLKYAEELKNCAGSYVNRISNGQYLLLMIFDNTKERLQAEHKQFMLGMFVSSLGLEFEQLKGPCNLLASDRQKEMVIKYLEEKDISFKEVRDLKIYNNKESVINN